MRCSERIRSTVAPKLVIGEMGVRENGALDGERLMELLRLMGVRGGEKEGGVGPHGADQGVCKPGVAPVDACLGVSASVAAFNNKFVVPSALVDPDRAEQTTATL